MQVVQFVGNFPPTVCGVGSYTQILSNHLAQHGVHMTIITGVHNVGAESNEHLTVLPVMDHWGLSAWPALKQHLNAIQPDVIHLQYQIGAFNDGALVFALPYLTRVPVVTTFHDYAGPKSLGKLGYLWTVVLLAASRHIIVTHNKPYSVFAKIPLLKRKMTQIPVGSNIPVVPVYPPAERKSSKTRPVLLFFGFVWRGKNIEMVLHTQRHLLDQGIESELRIVGEITDPEYLQELTALAESLAISDHVNFTGRLSSKAISAELQSADIGIFPYSKGVTTGHGTVVAAFEHLLPVVTTIAANTDRDFFSDRQNIILVPPDDGLALQQSVYELLTTPQLYETIRRNLQEMSDKTGWDHITRTHIDSVYAKVVDSSRTTQLTRN